MSKLGQGQSRRPQRIWVRWLEVLIALHAVGALITAAVAWSGGAITAQWIAATCALAGLAWAIIGLTQLWPSRVVRWTTAVYVALLTGLLIYQLARAQRFTASLAVAGIVGMGLLFFGGLWLIRAVLRPGLPTHGVAGVARTVIDEAIRMKIAMVFVALLLVMIPAMPSVLDPTSPLRYRVQFFLTWSLTLTSFLLSLMTIFLACKTITSELTEKQIYLTLTKPVSRFGYLMGKWLGVALLNLLLLSVAGAGIYTFALVLQYADADNPRSEVDRMEVRQQVLVSRASVGPELPDGRDFNQLVLQWLAERRQVAPRDFGQPGDPIDPKRFKEWTTQLRARWHTIQPRNGQVYRFSGLGAAADHGPTVQLRLKPKSSQSPPDGFVHLLMIVNGYRVPIPPLADDNVHVLDLDSRLIDQNGQLVIQLANVRADNPEATFNSDVSFAPGEGMEVLYRVGGFEGNLVRALALLWLRLAFLAMLGVAAGTFLGFPVACLLCMMVYFAAAASAFITESLTYYAALPAGDITVWQWLTRLLASLWKNLTEGKIWDDVKILIALIGRTVMFLIPSFGTFNPTPLLADGKVVPLTLLGGAVFRIGLLWTGLSCLLGWLIFRKRELAKVTV